MKNCFYFRHDSNARNDEKVLQLICEYDWWGYGIYMALLEMMYESNGKLSNDKLPSIAFHLHVESQKLINFVDSCVNIQLFKTDKKSIWSPRLLREIEFMQEKSSKASKSAHARWNKQDANAMRTQCESNETEEKINNDKPVKNKSSDDTLKKAIDKLTKEVEQYITPETEEEIRKFWLYWTEPNKSKTKVRYQLENTWDTKRRINTWLMNASKFNKR